jgi:hypothetical protein
MDAVDPRELMRPFEILEDPRAYNTIHPFANVLLIAHMAVISNAGFSHSGWTRVG